MHYFNTRNEAIKAYPNSIVRKIKNIHYLINKNEYIVFNNHEIYNHWRYLGYVV